MVFVRRRPREYLAPFSGPWKLGHRPERAEVTVNGNPADRYVEKTTEQAIVLKLVRYVSGLRACQLLLDHRFVQELGALQRVLTDIEEDVTFLTYSHRGGQHGVWTSNTAGPS